MSNDEACSSFVLQTAVMHLVLETDLSYWRENNLETCFSDSLKSLAEKLRNGSIVDIFFPKV